MSERKKAIVENLEKALEKAGPQAEERLAGLCEGVAFMAGHAPQTQPDQATA